MKVKSRDKNHVIAHINNVAGTCKDGQCSGGMALARHMSLQHGTARHEHILVGYVAQYNTHVR